MSVLKIYVFSKSIKSTGIANFILYSDDTISFSLDQSNITYLKLSVDSIRFRLN